MGRFRTGAVSVLLASWIFPALTSAQNSTKPDLAQQPTLYAVGYAHLDTEWRWEYPR
jgi:alpha-mannosidase